MGKAQRRKVYTSWLTCICFNGIVIVQGICMIAELDAIAQAKLFTSYGYFAPFCYDIIDVLYQSEPLISLEFLLAVIEIAIQAPA
ncbi:hypothetical protein N7486_008866 [Penicillium sp. IBT 16267x]|nr:hypothetical protein N7486_008866 [Penicillium sp. IBT 16267x]